MRLVNTETLQLEEFPNAYVPAYAILSHRWEKEEVVFADLKSEERFKKRGYSKIQAFCEEARSLGLSHGWVDTCCT